MLGRRLLSIMILVALLQVIFTPPAHAYLDPGTGSYIFQLLIAGVVGLAFVIKVFWGRIKGFFTRLFSRTGEQQVEETLEDSGIQQAKATQDD
jgi:hypothetical protein